MWWGSKSRKTDVIYGWPLNPPGPHSCVYLLAMFWGEVKCNALKFLLLCILHSVSEKSLFDWNHQSVSLYFSFSQLQLILSWIRVGITFSNLPKNSKETKNVKKRQFWKNSLWLEPSKFLSLLFLSASAYIKLYIFGITFPNLVKNHINGNCVRGNHVMGKSLPSKCLSSLNGKCFKKWVHQSLFYEC